MFTIIYILLMIWSLAYLLNSFDQNVIISNYKKYIYIINIIIFKNFLLLKIS